MIRLALFAELKLNGVLGSGLFCDPSVSWRICVCSKGDGGKVSVSGGTGRGGGGGGRIAIDCPRFENVDIFFHGWIPLQCAFGLIKNCSNFGMKWFQWNHFSTRHLQALFG